MQNIFPLVFIAETVQDTTTIRPFNNNVIYEFELLYEITLGFI